MPLSEGERASARAGDACPSEFGRIIVRIDEVEAAGGERVGGSTWAEENELKMLWVRIGGLSPSTLEGWRWLAQKQACAFWNSWDREEVTHLAHLAGDPLAVGC